MSLAGEGSHFETVSPSDLNGNRDDLDIWNCMHGHSRVPSPNRGSLLLVHHGAELPEVDPPRPVLVELLEGRLALLWRQAWADLLKLCPVMRVESLLFCQIF